MSTHRCRASSIEHPIDLRSAGHFDPSQTEKCLGLIDGAICPWLHGVLGYPTAEQQTGCAVVAASRVDTHGAIIEVEPEAVDALTPADSMVLLPAHEHGTTVSGGFR